MGWWKAARRGEGDEHLAPLVGLGLPPLLLLPPFPRSSSRLGLSTTHPLHITPLYPNYCPDGILIHSIRRRTGGLLSCRGLSPPSRNLSLSLSLSLSLCPSFTPARPDASILFLSGRPPPPRLLLLPPMPRGRCSPPGARRPSTTATRGATTTYPCSTTTPFPSSPIITSTPRVSGPWWRPDVRFLPPPIHTARSDSRATRSPVISTISVVTPPHGQGQLPRQRQRQLHVQGQVQGQVQVQVQVQVRVRVHPHQQLTHTTHWIIIIIIIIIMIVMIMMRKMIGFSVHPRGRRSRAWYRPGRCRGRVPHTPPSRRRC